ncbi:glutamine-hydrolyzing GMP synthase [Alkalibacterium iburiense]|uniref:GMP synthase [glutamine-hydrolyzing] n=2 Tax=Alkalibacterium iburiense TaxID=290589 RepID=A0ABN0XNM3_9LACT
MTVETDVKHMEKIAVLDFGGQFNQVLARRIRELGVYSEMLPYSVTADELQKQNFKGIIISGGPMSVNQSDAYAVDAGIFDLGLPILGIDYGMHLIAHHFGGTVKEHDGKHLGEVTLSLTEESGSLFRGLDKISQVWMSHSDCVTHAPENFLVTASSETYPVSAFENSHAQVYGVQFHPEVKQTDNGLELLKNFVFDTCQATGNWSMKHFIENQVKEIRQTVGDKKVLLGLSGGVDSSVVAVLLNKAIGDQLTCIFVDHGLLRKDEGDQVMESLVGKFGLNIIRVDAKNRFLSKLKGVSDPETKRKIIGNEFIEVFNDEASKLEHVDFLSQGTIYSDVIESGTETAQTIKSHHNVGGLPEDMTFELIEPLKTLFKDEVRKLGIELAMPESLVWRQPFPGPGLGIRVLGEITEEKLAIVRESDAVLRDEIKKAGLDRDIWQYFTVLPGIRSVGVKSDARTYDYTVGIRAITSVDGMTADFARIPWDVLQKISVRIVNEVPHVNRIVYDITSKPPATVEWE